MWAHVQIMRRIVGESRTTGVCLPKKEINTVTFADGANILGEGTINNAHALPFGKMKPLLFSLLASRRIGDLVKSHSRVYILYKQLLFV